MTDLRSTLSMAIRSIHVPTTLFTIAVLLVIAAVAAVIVLAQPVAVPLG
jgi:hypothetical protein